MDSQSTAFMDAVFKAKNELERLIMSARIKAGLAKKRLSVKNPNLIATPVKAR